MTAPFFFPLLFLRPDGDWAPIHFGPFRLARRLWGTSTFDLATLATRHKLHLQYQLMDVMLANCNLELQVEASSLEEAIDLVHTALLGLYLEGISPTIAPFATSHSINEYSGINSRDSEALRAKLPDGLREGITSNAANVEAWPVQLSLHCRVLSDSIEVSPAKFRAAAEKAVSWRTLENSSRALGVVRDAAQSAPLLGSADQSLLHVWCALEALFPKVSTEVSFRLALYLAQLQSASRRENFKRVRDAYNLRSRVAHGSYRGVTMSEWRQAWDLLCDCANAILLRQCMPGEDQLLDELLSGAAEAAQPGPA